MKGELQKRRVLGRGKEVTPDVNSGHETFFHAATCLA